MVHMGAWSDCSLGQLSKVRRRPFLGKEMISASVTLRAPLLNSVSLKCPPATDPLFGCPRPCPCAAGHS